MDEKVNVGDGITPLSPPPPQIKRMDLAAAPTTALYLFTVFRKVDLASLANYVKVS